VGTKLPELDVLLLSFNKNNVFLGILRIKFLLKILRNTHNSIPYKRLPKISSRIKSILAKGGLEGPGLTNRNVVSDF